MTGFSDIDAETMADMSARANRHLNWNTVMINPGQLEMWHAQLAVSDLARERGGWVVPQAIPHNFRTRTDFLDAELGFRNLPGWDALFVLEHDARLAALADPEVRRRLRRDLDTADNPFTKLYRESVGELVVNDVEDAERFGHLRGRRLGDLTTERGDHDPLETLFALAVETDLGIGFCRYAFRDDDEALQDARREMLSDPRVLLGASDGGAHIDGTMNTEYPTASFAELVRRRGWFTVEEMVHRLADVPARLYGLYDRGRIEPGFRADLVCFDPSTIAPGPAELVRDLPGGARRFLAGATGIDRVLVAGVEIVVDGQLTGEHPGRLLRAGVDSVTVPARATVAADG